VKHCLLYERHEAAGAALRPRDEASPLLTYGAVPEEYAAATGGAALFDETDRGLVRMRGGDAAGFLHRMSSNVVEALEPGQGNRNLLLTGKGKILFDFDLARTDEGFLLSVQPGLAPALIEALDRFLFAEDVQLEDLSEETAPLHLVGPGARALVEGLGLPAPEADHAHACGEVDGRPVRVTRLSTFGPGGYRLDGGPDAAAGLWQRLSDAGARPAGRILADILRVEHCRARWGEDVDEGVYPQEARLEEAFNLSKGCYPGQEVVAKIDTYGGLNKRLHRLRVSHSDPVPRGTRLYRHDAEKDEWRDLGVVTSWAYSFPLDSGQVLAYVKRRHQEPGTTFRLGEGQAQATLLD
jgi:folate-binding protein YgfZ